MPCYRIVKQECNKKVELFFHQPSKGTMVSLRLCIHVLARWIGRGLKLSPWPRGKPWATKLVACSNPAAAVQSVGFRERLERVDSIAPENQLRRRACRIRAGSF